MRLRASGSLVLLGLLALLVLVACSGDSPEAALDELLSLPDDEPSLLFFFTDN